MEICKLILTIILLHNNNTCIIETGLRMKLYPIIVKLVDTCSHNTNYTKWSCKCLNSKGAVAIMIISCECANN